MKKKCSLNCWPLLLAVLVIPLACYVNVVSVPGHGSRYLNALPVTVDFFVVPKIRILMICCAGVLWFFVREFFINGRKIVSLNWHGLWRWLWPLAVFAILLLMSCFASSQSPEVVVWGLLELWDGALLWFCSLLIAVFAFWRAQANVFSLRNLSKLLALGFVPLFVVGILQYFGFNILEKKMFQMIFSEYADLSFQMSYGAGWVTSTLYHPNIVGSYVALTAPIALGAAWNSKTQKTIFANWLWFGATLVMGVGAQSRAGFLGVVIACLSLLFVFLLKKNANSSMENSVRRNSNTHNFEFLFVSLVPCVLLFFSPTHHIRDDLILAGPQGWAQNSFGAARKVLDLRVENDWFVLDEGACSLTLHPNSQKTEGWDVSNVARKPVSFSQSGKPFWGEIRLLDAACARWKLSMFQNGNTPFVRVFDGVGNVDVGFLPVGARVVYMGSLLKPQKAEAFNFFLSDSFASSRGYIWNRTLPLIKNKPWFGYGPGAFPVVFPQDDLAGKLAVVDTWNRVDVLIDKPHSLYLGIAFAAGIPALLLLLFWWIQTIVSAFVLLHRKTQSSVDVDFNQIISFALGLVGYLVAGFFNDPNVAVDPLFWIISGALTGVLAKEFAKGS